jgi:uncharacterized protein YpbB
VQQIDDVLLNKGMSLSAGFAKKSKSKRWQAAVDELVNATVNKREQLLQLKYLNQLLHPETVTLPSVSFSIPAPITSPDYEEKPGFTDTLKTTLDLWKSPLSIEAIAQERSLAQSTVESHLSKLVQLGEIPASELLDPVRLSQIISCEMDWTLSLSELRIQFDSFSYFELKLAKILLSQSE